MNDMFTFILTDTFAVQLSIYSIILVVTFTFLLRAAFFFKKELDPLRAIKPSLPKINWFEKSVRVEKVNRAFEDQG